MDHPNFETGTGNETRRALLVSLKLREDRGVAVPSRSWGRRPGNDKERKVSRGRTPIRQPWKQRTYFESRTALGHVGQRKCQLWSQAINNGGRGCRGATQEAHRRKQKSQISFAASAQEEERAGPLGFSEGAPWRRASCS